VQVPVEKPLAFNQMESIFVSIGSSLAFFKNVHGEIYWFELSMGSISFMDCVSLHEIQKSTHSDLVKMAKRQTGATGGNGRIPKKVQLLLF